MDLLRKMDVPVRSPISQLNDDQVARVRVRWEREKRHRQEKPAAAPTRRRRAPAVEAAPAPTSASEPAASGSGVRRRRRVATPEVEEVPAIEEELPAIAATAPPEVVDVIEAPPAAPPEPEPEVEVAEEPVAPPPRVTRQAPQTTHSTGPSTPPPSQAPERARPRPVVPGAPRPRSMPGSSPFGPPRPVASATPSGGMGMPTRRDDRKPGGGGGGQQGGAGTAPPSGSQRRKKGKRGAVDQEEVSANIRRTMSTLGGVAGRRTIRRSGEEGREEVEANRLAAQEREKKTVRVNEFITVAELAGILKVPATQIVAFAFKNLGLMVTINQRLDFDQIELIAGEFGFEAVREQEYAAESKEEAEEDREEDRRTRPPVVTIMGHA